MIYVTGDMHGDLSRLHDPALRRLKKDDLLIVCGDFGFLWRGDAKENKLLKKMAKNRFTVAFLDGRHENFDLLSRYPTEEWHGGQAQVINPRLVHLCRGEIYALEGKRCFVLGGGESDDKEFRQPGISWWAAESPTADELQRALDNLTACGNAVDYIFTHVPPLTSANRLNPKSTVDGVSLFLGGIENTVKCKRWYFGCLHKDKMISNSRQAVFESVLPVD